MSVLMQLQAKKPKSVVGLELATDSVAATEVRNSGELTRTAVATMPDGAFREGEVTDPDAVAATLRTLFAENKLSKRVRLGVANQRVVVRTLSLPAMEDPEELASAVRYQAQELLPMPLEQAVLDHQVIGGKAASDGSPALIDLILVAARREMIDAALRPLRKAGLQPVGIDLSAFGLIRALGGAVASENEQPGEDLDAPSEGKPVLICDLGDPTNLAVSRRRSCLFTRVAPVGIGSIADRLGSSAGLSREHARMWMDHVGLTDHVAQIEGDPVVVAATREALVEGADALAAELRLSLDFYAAQAGAEPVERVVLAGAGTAIDGFVAAISSDIGIPFEVGVPPALRGYDPAAAARLTLSYGLALDS
jgi:type IV pilus assembly protein PilM